MVRPKACQAFLSVDPALIKLTGTGTGLVPYPRRIHRRECAQSSAGLGANKRASATGNPQS